MRTRELSIKRTNQKCNSPQFIIISIPAGGPPGAPMDGIGEVSDRSTAANFFAIKLDVNGGSTAQHHMQHVWGTILLLLTPNTPEILCKEGNPTLKHSAPSRHFPSKA